MTSKVLQLTPSETYEFVVEALACRQIPYIAGKPGIGKSDIVKQVAKDSGAVLIDIRLSQMLPEDLTGLPEKDPKTGKATYVPFDLFPVEGDVVPDGYNGWIVFFDELSSASEEVMAAIYKVFLDRMVGQHKLHPKVMIIAAGNRATDSAIARELPDTLLTRMLPIEMKSHAKDWLLWADGVSFKNQAVIDFIKKNQTMLNSSLDPKDRGELENTACPRGWAKVMVHMNRHEKRAQAKAKDAVDSSGLPMESNKVSGASEQISTLTYNLMAAAVGHMSARAFREEYDESIKLPYPWEVAQAPSSTRIPTTTAGKVNLTASLAEYFLESPENTRENVLSYMNRMGGDHSPVFVEMLKEGLGATPSDLKLIETVCKRLNVTSIPDVAGEVDKEFPF